MKTISEARQEFNSIMNPYTLVAIQTEHFSFTDELLSSMKLILPSWKINYTPPPWVGAYYSPEFFAVYKTKNSPEKSREEEIPNINPYMKYLLCDDYVSTGETFEIAMIRLVDAGVNLENIWGITMGNDETKRATLEKGIEWHRYKLRHRDSLPRVALREMGFDFPALLIS